MSDMAVFRIGRSGLNATVESCNTQKMAEGDGDADSLNKDPIAVSLRNSFSSLSSIRAAAADGDAVAIANLALLIVADDSKRSLEVFNKALKIDRRSVWEAIWTVLKQPDEAERQNLWGRLALLGDAGACYVVGLRLAEEDFAKGRRWLQFAADRGHVRAMTALGQFLHFSEPAEAERWDRQAADLGDTLAMYNLGVLMVNRGETKDARAWWQKAAELESPSAMRALGRSLRCRHPKKAKRWFQKAAAKGDSAAMVEVALSQWRRGLMLVGTYSPPSSAQEMMKQAAEKGNPNAMWFLAVWSFLQDDKAESQRWLEAGAEQGDRACKRALESGLTLRSARSLRRLQNRPPEPTVVRRDADEALD